MSSATAVLAERNVRRILRNPGAVVGGLVTPVVMLLALWTVFGRAMDASGVAYGQYILPGAALQAVIFTAGGSAMAIGLDRTNGLLDRQRSLPIPTTAPIVARLGADLTRSIASVLVVTLAGALIGFRFSGSALEALVYIGALVAFAAGLSLLFDAIALAASSAESAAIVVQTATIPLVLLSTAYSPADSMPDWAGPIIAHLPVSAVSEAMRQAATGSLEGAAALEAGLWCVGIIAAGLALGVRAFRRSA